jgi:hypothetical protein
MQARVRAGESPESVAKAAGVPLDRVLRFVAPVISEREYIAEQAQKAAVRRPGGEGPGPVLGPTVLAKLATRGIAEDAVAWDAWRRDDAKWTVQVTYTYEDRERTAEWTYDPGARAAIAEDDDARALSGVRPPVDTSLLGDDLADLANLDSIDDQSLAALRDADMLRRLAVGDPESVAATAKAFGFAPDAETPEPVPVGGRRLAAVRGRGRGGRRHDNAALFETDDSSEGFVADDTPVDTVDRDDTVDVAGAADAADAPDADGARSRNRRAHVPSWDEIMFGRRRPRD